MITADERKAVTGNSPFHSYTQKLDRESAYEILTAQGQQELNQAAQQQQAEVDAKAAAAQAKIDAAQAKADARAAEIQAKADEKAAAQRNKVIGSVATSVVRSIGVQLSGSLVRGLMGTIFGGRKR
jgi:F0F1-type ATP synthase membrane subunit b/b'